MNRNSDRNACEDLMDGDPMKLKSYNHPGIILVSTCLVGTNYRSQSRAMRIAVGAKQKLGFVDGKINLPEAESEGYKV